MPTFMDILNTKLENLLEEEFQVRNTFTLNKTVTKSLIHWRNLLDGGKGGEKIQNVGCNAE